MKKQLKIAFSMFAFVVLSLVFAGVYASDKPTITMKPAGGFFIGESQEFTITTTVPEGYEEVMVIGDGVISDESAIEKLEYYEVKDGKWYALDSMYGGSTGFPLTSATSKFRVTFKTAGEYTITYCVKKVDGGEVLAENTMVIEVADKTVRDVSTEAELKAALEDTTIKTINIAKDMTISSKVNIVRDVTINGNSHKLTFTGIDSKVWGGHYVLQAYRCNVTLSDITLTGGNAGLLVNGAKVAIKGKIDVSGNGFGGIEISTSDENYVPFLYNSEATIVNTTETKTEPTIWEDPTFDDFPIEDHSMFYAWSMEEQYFYYLDSENIMSVDEQLEQQLEDDEIYIEALRETNVISKELLNKLKDKEGVNVRIATETCIIEFNTDDIKTEFTKDLNLDVNITTKQPFTSNVLKDVKSNLLFVDLEYSGVLPDNTMIHWYCEGYDIGEKPYLYYYNAKEDKLELIKDGIKDFEYDDEYDYSYATIIINHASTYFVSSEEIDLAKANANSKPVVDTTKNPNTSDMSIVIATVLGVVAVSGFVIVKKQKLFNK